MFRGGPFAQPLIEHTAGPSIPALAAGHSNIVKHGLDYVVVAFSIIFSLTLVL
jgi:uncharacterized protein YsxB (DUF464 family)